jgi:hypothetical protein
VNDIKKYVLGYETTVRMVRVFRGSRHPAFRLQRISVRQVSAVELNSFQHLTARKHSIMQKRKLGKLGNPEVSAIGLGWASVTRTFT